MALGVDLGHTGYRPSVKAAQTIYADLFDGQARGARAGGQAGDRRRLAESVL
jgi:hypothetical protein